MQKVDSKLIVHRVRITDGEFAEGATVLAKVDPEWRLGARQAHSGTHVRARRAAPGARAGGAAVRLLQQARLPAARLRLGPGAVRGHPQRARGGRQPGGPPGPAGPGAVRLAGTRRRRWARSRCSARPTTTPCGSSRSAGRGRSSCAAAPTSSTPRRSARSRSPRESSVGSGPAPGGGGRRHRGVPPAGRRADPGVPAGRLRSRCSRASCRAGSRRCSSGCGSRRRSSPGCGRRRCRRRPATLADGAVDRRRRRAGGGHRAGRHGGRRRAEPGHRRQGPARRPARRGRGLRARPRHGGLRGRGDAGGHRRRLGGRRPGQDRSCRRSTVAAAARRTWRRAPAPGRTAFRRPSTRCGRRWPAGERRESRQP